MNNEMDHRDPDTSNNSSPPAEAEMAEAETAEPFLVVRPRKFTLEERKVAIRTIIGGDTGDHGNYFVASMTYTSPKVLRCYRIRIFGPEHR